MKNSRILLIFSIGLFAILSQVLLFREFLVAFEDNELGIGAFFASWFLWIVIGAAAIYHSRRLTEVLIGRFEYVALLYLPAFVVQFWLITHAREVVGIDPYQLFSMGPMIGAAFLVNGPISLMTGMLFPLCCRWVDRQGGMPVARVYVIESAGSFVGGIVATILLAWGVDWPVIFLLSSGLLCCAAAAARARLLPAPLALGLVCFLAIPSGAPSFFSENVARAKWLRLLPKSQFAGTFQTPQGEYLYGIHKDQFIVASSGEICLALPERASAAEIAAIHLSQNPKARRVLLAGFNSLSIARQLLRLPQITEITIYDPDPHYFERLTDVLPDEHVLDDPRLHIAGRDIRTLLRGKPEHFDLIVLNLPDPTTAVLNRHFTVEFYRIVQAALAIEGVLGVRLTGGENVIGSELTALGASAWRTLGRVFGRIAVKPGEETWLLASDSADLVEDPAKLFQHYSGIAGGGEVYPPSGLFSLYRGDRVALARRTYQDTYLPDDLAINRDAKPLAHLYSLLLLARHADSSLAGFFKKVSLAGIMFFILPIIVFVFLRSVYVLGPWRSRAAAPAEPSQFESVFLVFSAGLVCIGVDIVLLYLYQTTYGSLRLHIGMISSLLMLGLFVGAGIASLLLRSSRLSWRTPALIVVTVQTALLFTAGFVGQWHYATFIIGFVVCGLLTGMYFPMAAQSLQSGGRDSRRSGAALELADHFGAAVGGFLTGLVALPVLGGFAALQILAAMLATNIVLLVLQSHRLATGSAKPKATRPLGYICFGLIMCVIISSHLLTRAARRLSPELTMREASLLAGDGTLGKQEAPLPGSGETFAYFEVTNADSQFPEYIFSSRGLVRRSQGFGGPIELLIRLSADGEVLGFDMLRSNETPVYLDKLHDWNRSLVGRNVFQADQWRDIDAVSGATISANAIVAVLRRAGQVFVSAALGKESISEIGVEPPRQQRPSVISAIYLLLAMMVAVMMARRGGRWRRRLFLLCCVVVGGYWLNLQYSSEQVISLLAGSFPAWTPSTALLLILAAPCFVAIFGNLYCGYLCPFGGLQELIADLVPAKWRLRPDRDLMHWARFGKYIILAVLLCAFFFTKDRQVLAPDVLTSFFSRSPLQGKWLILLPLAAMVFFVPRFWCRCLCPAGAFLGLIGAYAPLKKLFPRKVFSRCDLSVTSSGELDCICCDRCRYEITTAASIEPRKRHAGLVTAAALVLIVIMALISARSVSFDGQAAPVPVRSAARAPGVPREIDAVRMQTLIDQGQLSEHEAHYYNKMEPSQPGSHGTTADE